MRFEARGGSRGRDPGELRHLETGKSAALRFVKKALSRPGEPEVIVTDRAWLYPAAMPELRNWNAANCAGISTIGPKTLTSIPTTRAAMLGFRPMKALEVAFLHSSSHNLFNSEHHLVDRQTYRERRLAAQAEWQSLDGLKLGRSGIAA
jgi:putative transposase